MAENAFLNTFYSFRRFLWNCLFVVFYPIITTFSLFFMGIIWLFSGLSQLLSKISTSKTGGFELKKPSWKNVGTIGSFTIEKLFVDDIMFGPTYFKFRATPSINSFENFYFGDFVYPCFDGVLLQRWNATTVKDLPDFTLVILDGQTGNMIDIQRIKSFSWNAEQQDENVIKIKWFNGIEGGEVIVDRRELESKI